VIQYIGVSHADRPGFDCTSCPTLHTLAFNTAILTLTMSLATLVNGADCGPLNPLQGLTKNFDSDRGLQQVHATRNVSVVALDVDEHFHRTTLGPIGLVLPEAYAYTCLCSHPFLLTSPSLWPGIPHGADGAFELWGGCYAFLLCKSKSISNSPLSAITV
jgi:hypothetical protein